MGDAYHDACPFNRGVRYAQVSGHAREGVCTTVRRPTFSEDYEHTFTNRSSPKGTSIEYINVA